MPMVRIAASILLVLLVLAVGRQSQAIIYKYVDEKGEVILLDDLQKVPEQFRTQAVVVSGEAVTERSDDLERARAAAMAADRANAARIERAEAEQRSGISTRTRVIITAVVVSLIAAALFAIGNISALKEKERLVSGVRTGMAVVLVLYLVIMHGRDVLALFGHAGDRIQSIQDEQAARGKKAAEFYKTMDRLLDPKTSDQAMQEMEKQAKEKE